MTLAIISTCSSTILNWPHRFRVVESGRAHPRTPDVHRSRAVRDRRRGDSVRLRTPRPAARPMSDEALLRENSYLKARIAQLQSDVADLSAEVDLSLIHI